VAASTVRFYERAGLLSPAQRAENGYRVFDESALEELAFIQRERNPKVLAQLARRSMRKKITVLEEAFTGHFIGHHAFLLGSMLARVDAITAGIAALDVQIAAHAAPPAHLAARLDEIPGISLASAYVILAESGTDMTRFPTAGHLTSWARLAPGIKESAGKKKGKGSTGHGNAYLAAVLGNAAAGAAKTDTFLGERYRRIARRRGSKRSIMATGRAILVIVWHLLPDPDARFHDLGPGYYDARIDPERRKRNHIRQLEALGYKVTLDPAA
jgi:transposase